MNGTLFSQEFLEVGITGTPVWRDSDEAAFESFVTSLRAIHGAVDAISRINEAATESELIFPTLTALGWTEVLPQQTANRRGREDVPDALLFADATRKAAARAERSDERRYLHGLAILESKRWLRPLDRADDRDADYFGTPSAQMLRYLSRVEIASDRRIQWGILSNGRHWRLYWQGARSRAEQFLELDLGLLLRVPGLTPDLFAPEAARGEHWLKVFWLLFRCEAFQPQPEDGQARSFHALALDEGRFWEAQVSQDLGRVVFDEVFPSLVQALLEHDPQRPAELGDAWLAQVREDALILLYRLLFLLYAEDRRLLPTHDRRYDDYSFRRVREDIARRSDAGDVFSATQPRYARGLQDLFRAIDRGDDSIGMPPYNGGLFDDAPHPLLTRVALPDATLAPLIDRLSRRPAVGDGDRHWINYRDLSVRQLGSIYERLLEFSLVAEHGAIVIQPSPFARKTSGSYYTHDDLVDLLVARTLGPLVGERITAFEARNAALKSDRRDRTLRLRELADADAALALLDLKICDPAMGSGHFLVAVVDYLADQVLEQLAAVEDLVDWAEPAHPYCSPLTRRISNIRDRIFESARANHWRLDEEQLDDRQIVRRMILKRVIFGVDKNPMAVELAKLALWLHTFTVGAPLSFLDHHLRCGDSLFGERVETVADELRSRYGALFLDRELTRIGAATDAMAEIGELTDIGIAEVRQSYNLFADIERELSPLWTLLSFWHSLRWLAPARKLKADDVLQRGLAELLSGHYGELLHLLQHGGIAAAGSAHMAAAEAADALLRAARRLGDEQGFFHWQLAFPTVWRGLVEHRPRGGFDAIIGNPPWDRMKLQQVEWFAARRPEIARQARAADRKRLIAALESDQDPLAAHYSRASQAAETAARVARESGDYPLLSGGDMNLYSLFVERAANLVQPRGIVGLLTPSGIAADLGAADFFRSIATTGRLGALLDFENRRGLFPDVDSRFKFCALVFGGAERRFAQTETSFFLHSLADLDDEQRRVNLTAADFAALNPNTGTAPIFRRRRDAEITAAIYRRLPVLVDHRGATKTRPAKKVWPVRYATMFHMTNDSGLFKRRDELEREGWYPVGSSRWRRGAEEAVPLYVGRMIHQYDHRAASVIVNEENLHNAALSITTTATEHADPSYVPTPQFWITTSDERLQNDGWRIGFRDIARATDVRTIIASIASTTACGNTLPLLLPDDEQGDGYATSAPLLLANLNSLVTDYVARQKVQSTHLNWYVLEQLAIVPAAAYTHRIGRHVLADFIRDQVLHLSYTAHDLSPFARDLGYTGLPFEWNEEDRRHRIARLDAIYFHLYGLSRNDTAYVLDQFPIVREQDQAAFRGRFRTRELVLGYFNAVVAGDLDTRIEL